MKDEGLASGNAQADAMTPPLIRDYAHPEGAIGEWTKTLPIATSDGPYNATVLKWKRVENGHAQCV